MATEDRTSPAPVIVEGQTGAEGAEAEQSRASRYWGETRRLPIFPILILLIVLVFPAIFAESDRPSPSHPGKPG